MVPSWSGLSALSRRRSQAHNTGKQSQEQEGTIGQFEVRARLKIRQGQLQGFKRQAAEMMRQAREKDTGTVAYDHQLRIYGDPEPRLVELFDRVGVDVTWFTLLQALEPASVD